MAMASTFEKYSNFIKDFRVALVLILVSGFFMLNNLWQVTEIRFLEVKQPTPISAPLADSTTTLNIPSIASWHLFGLYNQSVIEVPKTKLQLSLQGIALSLYSEKDSHAIITAPNQPIKVYQVGDTVPGGAVIRQIFRDQVILDDNGRLESLNLPVPKINTTFTEAKR